MERHWPADAFAPKYVATRTEDKHRLVRLTVKAESFLLDPANRNVQ
jgi:hypothetical protein